MQALRADDGGSMQALRADEGGSMQALPPVLSDSASMEVS